MSDVPQSPEAAGADSEPRRARVQPAAIVGLLLLAAVWAWWAWQDGGYFPVVVLPGHDPALPGGDPARRLRAVADRAPPLAGRDRRRRRPGCARAAGRRCRRSGARRPDIAVGDGQRIAMYAIAFGLGIGVCNLLGPRMKLSLLPLAFAGRVRRGSRRSSRCTAPQPARRARDRRHARLPARLSQRERGVLRDRDVPGARARLGPGPRLAPRAAVALGATTLCIDFAAARPRAAPRCRRWSSPWSSTSSPRRYRVRALSWLALAALPALGMVPALTDLFHAAGDGRRHAPRRQRRDAARASTAAITSLAAIALGRRRGLLREPPAGPRQRAARAATAAVLGGLAGLAVVGVIAFVVAVGSPTQWIVRPARRVPPQRLAGPLAELEPLRRQPRLEPLRRLAGGASTTPRAEPAARRRRRRLPVLLPAQARRRGTRTCATPTASSWSCSRSSGIVGFALFATFARRRGRRRAARPTTRALRGRAARRSRSRAPATGSSTPRSTGSGPTRRSPRRCSALLGCACAPAVRAPGAPRRPALAPRLGDRRARGARAERRAAVAVAALRQRRLRELAHRPQPRLRRPRPGAVAQPAQRPAAARRGLDRAAPPATAERALAAFREAEPTAPRGMGDPLPARRAAGERRPRRRPRSRRSSGRCDLNPLDAEIRRSPSGSGLTRRPARSAGRRRPGR